MRGWFAAIAMLWLAGCARCSPQPAPSRTVLAFEIPRAEIAPHRGDPLLTGLTWNRSRRTEAFEDVRGAQQPHAHLQFMADETNLYLGFYAADQDLRTRPRAEDARGAVGDRLTLTVGVLTLVLNPKGGQLPPGVTMLSDVDGSIDDSRDDDEEWIVELTIPWTTLGPRAREDGVLVRAVRTDAPKGTPERAMAWPRSGQALVRFPAQADGGPGAAVP